MFGHFSDYFLRTFIYIILYTVSIYCILFIVFYILNSVHCILYTLFCILYSIHCILHTVFWQHDWSNKVFLGINSALPIQWRSKHISISLCCLISINVFYSSRKRRIFTFGSLDLGFRIILVDSRVMSCKDISQNI